MSDRVSAAESEPILVQLARLDGKLDRLDDRIGEVRSGVDRHQLDIELLKALSQTLQEGAAASKETAVALALALKDAKETQEATVRAETTKANQVAFNSDRSWVPYARLITAVAALVAVATLYIQLKP